MLVLSYLPFSAAYTNAVIELSALQCCIHKCCYWVICPSMLHTQMLLLSYLPFSAAYTNAVIELSALQCCIHK